jgi:hypothetical protein
MQSSPTPGYRPPILRSCLFLIGWLGLGVFGLNAVSQRRIVDCAYQGTQPHCQLTTQKLFESTGPVELDQPQAAQLEEYDSNTSDSSTMYRVLLITRSDRVALTSQDSSGFSHKHQMVEDINQFLTQPRSAKLRIDGGDGALFWIVGGIFGSLSVLFIGGTGLTISLWWRNRSIARILTGSAVGGATWGATLEPPVAPEAQHRRIDAPPPELPRSVNWENELTDPDQ